MRASAIGIVGLVLGLALGAGSALAQENGSIVIRPAAVNPDGSAGATYFDSCGVHVTPIFNGFVGLAIIRVYARLAGTSLAGISSAEFYIDGLETGSQLPAGWTKTVRPPAGTIPVGNISDPVTTGGDIVRRYNLTWDVDQPGGCQQAGFTLIAEVELRSGIPFTTNFAPGHQIHLVIANPPSNPTYLSPMLLLCDNPIFTPVAVTGSDFSFNADCSTAVHDRTWSQVKNLYR